MARYVTVASVSHAVSPEEGEGRREALLERARGHAERAARQGADLVAFPECYAQLGRARGWGPMIELAEPLDGPTISAMGAEAKRLDMHVIWPALTREENGTFNSAVLLDRGGNVAGVYHKMHPTIDEIEAGITPGDGVGVFDVDLGRIGICICFDLNFRDTMEGLREAGPEVVFFCSMYRGGLQVRMWAYTLAAYFVTAITGELGMIVDRGGEVLAESTSEVVIAQRINLDSRLLHLDGNSEKLDGMLAKYGTGISFRYYSREGCFTLASELGGVSVEDLMAEFGLEGREDYFRRAERTRDEALNRARRG
jgi:hypothetical protein